MLKFTKTKLFNCVDIKGNSYFMRTRFEFYGNLIFHNTNNSV